MIGMAPMRIRTHVPRPLTAAILMVTTLAVPPLGSSSQPVRVRHGMVVAQEPLATRVGLDILQAGGSAVDAAVATALALAVTYPTAGNIGGGGFMLVRPDQRPAVVYDFREVAPAAAHPDMFVVDGAYDAERHRYSHLAVGVPGTVAGLHLAWSQHGRLPWRRLVAPAIDLARRGFIVSDELARSLSAALPRMRRYPASLAQFSRNGEPYAVGERLRQAELAGTLERIAADGPAGFYAGETARLIDREMRAHGGMITLEDLAAYRPEIRPPIVGSYRGYEILSAPPPSSGGTALVQMLNVLHGFDLSATGPGSAQTVHLLTETMRRAFADRARYLGDPAFNPTMPMARLLSRAHADATRRSIDLDRASVSSPESFAWPREGAETTHLSVVDADRQAVSLTYTLEQRYGSGIVVPGAGFLLNNEMGDFNAAPGLTTADGLVGTPPNLAEPGKRMLSSMTPTIVLKDDDLFLLTGSPGGRTIINTVLLTLINVIDFGMNVQEAIDAPRFHHQWLPDRILFERHGLSPDTVALLEAKGHTLVETTRQGAAQAILHDPSDGMLAGAPDRRTPGSTALGY